LAQAMDLDIDKIICDKIDKNADKYPVEKSYGKSKKYNEQEG
jgi:hypothetical protein